MNEGRYGWLADEQCLQWRRDFGVGRADVADAVTVRMAQGEIARAALGLKSNPTRERSEKACWLVDNHGWNL